MKGDLRAQNLRMRSPEYRQKQKAALKKLKRVFVLSLLCCVLFGGLMATTAYASDIVIGIGSSDEAGGMGPLEVIFIFAFLSLLPSIFLMMTSFTRIIIVLSFLRNALGTAQSPPNMVLVGLAIFLSLMIMMPVLTEMNEVAFQPYQNGELEAMEALDAAVVPVKKFMLEQTNVDSLNLFLDLSKTEAPQVADVGNPVELLELSIFVITPAFITSELTQAFLMGFLVFLPFLVIDLVVSSILMSMGMVMLPPAMISLPFKILLFVMSDGWNLMMGTLVRSFEFT